MSLTKNMDCEAEVMTVGKSDAGTTTVATRKGRKRRQQRRFRPRRLQVLLNPTILESLFCGFRELPDVGPSDLLKLRQVCQTWAPEVLRLPNWVWTRWVNPVRHLKEHFDELKAQLPGNVRYRAKTCRGLKTRENIGLRINAVRSGQKLVRENRPAIELIDSRLPMTHRKSGRRSGYRCFHCNGRGQGRSRYCFNCPGLVERRKTIGTAKQQQRAAQLRQKAVKRKTKR